ncbi:MAG: hypothetical protein OEM05_14040 [Myxococcales bacterium]|nr:hypothetical protein [Myxococcales bacterium]
MGAPDARPQLTPWQLVAAILQGAFYLAYPFVIYFAHTRWATRGVGGVLLGLYAAAFLLGMRGSAVDLWHLLRQHAAVAVLIVVAIVLDDRTLLLLLPMLVSLYLLGTFSWSLYNGPSMIERFARMVEDDLPPFTFSYCRRVTWVWCGFMAFNAVTIGALALSAPLRWWALYTGLVFYLLMGLLVGAEFCFRKWWFRYYGSGPVDRLFARLFPAEATANGRRSLAYVEQRAAPPGEPTR